MKAKILCVSLCALLTLSLSAQDNSRKGEFAHRKANKEQVDCKAHKRTGKEARQIEGRHRELSAEDMARHRAAKMKAELQLSDEQYAKVYDLYLEDAKKIKAQKEGTEQELTAQQKKAMREEREATMKSLLSDEQFAKWKDIVTAHRHHKHNKK